jgi:hypothetical protein
MSTIKLVWKNNDINTVGSKVAKYKFGNIFKYKGKYQISYFKNIGMYVEHAENLSEAKKKLDKISAEKTKSQSLKGSLPKGMTKAVAKNIKIEGLSKTTGRILKGYKYKKGGKIVKTKAKLESERKCKTKK